MCDKAVDNHSRTLWFVPDGCKIQKICDKAVDIYPFAIQVVDSNICDKAVYTCYTWHCSWSI